MYKNTLVRFAAREAGVDDRSTDLLVGPHGHHVRRGRRGRGGQGAARRTPRPTRCSCVKGGLLGTTGAVRAEDVEALADLPPREVLLAQLAGALPGPARSRLAGLLQALPRNFAYGLKALIDQRRGGRLEPHRRAATEPPPTADEPRAAPTAATTDECARQGERETPWQP